MLLLAAYAASLTEAQVRANFAAWLEDSPPLTPDAVVWGSEDEPFALHLAATDRFDQAFPSPNPNPTLSLTLPLSLALTLT